MRLFSFIFVFLLSFSSYSQDTVRNDVQAVLKKVIPRFKASGTVHKVLDALIEETIQKDPDSPVLSAVYFPQAQFDDGGFEIVEVDPAQARKISVDFENLTVREIIKNICVGYNLRFKVEKNNVVILHPNEEIENLRVRFFKLAISDIKKFNEAGAQEFLESQGVVFNLHSFAKYLPSVNAVAVKNIDSELKKAENCFMQFRINEHLQAIRTSLNDKDIKIPELHKLIKDLGDYKDSKYEKSLEREEEEVRLNSKLNIIIPKVRFIGRDLYFIVDFIRRVSRDLDEDGEGINIMVKGDFSDFNKTINLDLDDGTVQDIIRFSSRKFGLAYKVDHKTVIIGRQTKDAGIVKSYDVSDTFIKYAREEHKNDFKKSLQYLGVKFKAGASLDYIKSIQRLPISNTIPEHKKLKEIFKFFNK